MVKNGKYLITGGSGFLGNTLISRLVAQNSYRLVVLARNEGELLKLQDKFPDVEIIPGDVADQYVCEKACRDVDGIFHLAAFKHVRMAEMNTQRCIRSNIIGTLNLLNMSLKFKPDIFVLISTDKAANIRGVYGATKLLGEKLVEEFAEVNSDTKYRVVRYGNVWNSTGSFITKWRPLMKAGQEVMVTDPGATRFFFTVDDAVSLIFRSIDEGKDAKPFVPAMKAVSIGTVLEACQEVYGKCPVKTIGLQAGENMHETMDGKIFSNEVEQYTKEDFIKEFLCPIR